jgi:hypothetical protein
MQFSTLQAFEDALRALRPRGQRAASVHDGPTDDRAAVAQARIEAAGLALLFAPHELDWRGRLPDLRDQLRVGPRKSRPYWWLRSRFG